MTRSVPMTVPKLVLTLLLSFGLAFPLAPTVAAQGAAGTMTDATSQTRRSLEALASLLDPTEFDVDELALDLAFEDPQDIVTWVGENLRYQVYRGVLRGPQGTLVAGAGNALDQAVLLARLLGDAGYDARVVLGELSEEDARTLVMSMFDEPLDPATSGDEAVQGAIDGLVRAAEATGTDPAQAAAAAADLGALELRDLPAFQDALAQAQAILSEMGRPTGADALPTLVAEARTYAWVEYRLGQDEPWVTAQPAWPSTTAAPPEVTAIQVIEEAVPPELLHHLRVEVTIERKRGSEFETAALMTPWQRPVANLLGHPIVIGNTALDASGATDLATMGAEMAESAFYAPVLNGALAPGALAFDLAGNLVPPDDAMSAMAGVFQTGASRVGDAIGALGAMGGDEPPEEPFALTAQWVDFVLVAPGGEETRHRRTVFDRRPPQARAAGTTELLDESALLENLISTYVVMATGGALSSAFVASQLHEQAVAHLDVLDSLANLRSSGGHVDEDVALLEALADYVPKDHLELFASSDAVDHVLRGVAYRAEPGVVALVGTMTPTTDTRVSTGVDIIANAKRTLHVVDGAVLYDVEGAVLAGAWDTVVEREFIEADVPASDTALNHGPATRWTVLRPGDHDDLGLSVVPRQALTAVRADLANGYVILVPAVTEVPAGTGSPVGGPAGTTPARDVLTTVSYWRVDLATGETLGMTAAGRGGAMVEFLVSLTVGLLVGAALAVPGIAMCAGSGASWLCYCDVIATGALIGLGGALFGALIGAEAALLYAVFDVGVVAPVTTVFSLPTCSGWTYAGTDPTRAVRDAQAACWAA